MKLTAPQKRVLARAEEVVWDVPYGDWRLDGELLRRSMCQTLERAGLIERGEYLGSSIYYCRLTKAGALAISSHHRSTTGE